MAATLSTRYTTLQNFYPRTNPNPDISNLLEHQSDRESLFESTMRSGHPVISLVATWNNFD
eukprot:scaffold15101_cov28-Cyclotella_meneghiniana.AAC.1